MVNRRDGVVCLSPEAGAYDELGPAVLEAHPYDFDQTAEHAAHGVVDARRRPARASCPVRDLASVHTPASWLQAQISAACALAASASSSQHRHQAGRTVNDELGLRDELGRRLRRPDGDADSVSRRPSDASRARAAKASRSPRSSPAKQAIAVPTTSASTTVPLSAGTGGLTSRAIFVGYTARP